MRSWVAPICALSLSLLQCQSLPDDPDRAPGLARELRVGTQHRDLLECTRRDCVDWYRVYVGQPGTLFVTTESQFVSSDVRLEVFLGDDRARPLDRSSWTRRAELQQRVTPGYYFIRVETQTEAAIPYLVRTAFEPRIARVKRPTRPEPPRVEPARGRIVEVESRAGNAFGVLFKLDGSARAELGQRGRLVRGADVIAEVEVTEVYSGGGARARLLGAASERIDSDTVIVIDVRTERR